METQKERLKNNLSTEELLPGGTDDDDDIDHILGDYAAQIIKSLIANHVTIGAYVSK